MKASSKSGLDGAVTSARKEARKIRDRSREINNRRIAKGFEGLEPTERKIIAKVLEESVTIKEAAKKVVGTHGAATWAQNRHIKNIKKNGFAMELMLDGQILKIQPITSLLLKTQKRLEEFIEQPPLCDKCGKDVGYDPKDVLAAVKLVLASMDEGGGPLGRLQRALEHDFGAESTTAELATQYLRDRQLRIEQQQPVALPPPDNGDAPHP